MISKEAMSVSVTEGTLANTKYPISASPFREMFFELVFDIDGFVD